MKTTKLFLTTVTIAGIMLLGCTPSKLDNPDVPDNPEPNTSSNVGPRANDVDDPANGIYVSPSGNDDTATGSIDKPFKSINAALAAVPSGNLAYRYLS